MRRRSTATTMVSPSSRGVLLGPSRPTDPTHRHLCGRGSAYSLAPSERRLEALVITLMYTLLPATSRGKDHFAHETFSAPIEPHVAPHVALYHRLHHLGTKALARRGIDRRTSRLGPAEH
jgi:hypothetical protein